jgi:butyrate response factor 1
MFENQISNFINNNNNINNLNNLNNNLNNMYNQNLVYDYFQEFEKIRDPKYKTELCKKFEDTGKCPYGFKCRFAHGKEELNSKNTGNNYKKKLCKTFLENGFCPYGSRCSFKHDERTLNDIKLPYYYIKTFIYNNFDSNYRLNIFEEITNRNFNSKNYCNNFNVNNNINNQFNSECFKNKDLNDVNSSTTSTISIESEDNF